VRWEAVAELEALQSSTTCFQDMVLGDVDGLSSLVMSLSAVSERLEGWIDPVLRW
jgi:hypothetical protein